MVKSYFKDNRKKWDHFSKALPELKALEVVIGVQSGETRTPELGETGTTDLVAIALFNELGTATIPARPFISTASDERRSDWWNRFDKALEMSLFAQKGAEYPFAMAGQTAERDIKRKIDDITTPPNSDVTIKLKGSSKPLIDKGQLRGSIRYLVRKVGS